MVKSLGRSDGRGRAVWIGMITGFIGALGCWTPLLGQEVTRPSMLIGSADGGIVIDGALAEEAWQKTEVVSDLRTTVPEEGGMPSGRTEIRVVAEPRNLYVSVRCFDDDPDGIVRFSKLRDAELDNEDHVRIVLDPYLDGQSGYIFAVNAHGARYDALVADRGERENDDWDAVWEARTTVDAEGWTVEIKIPIQSINFARNVEAWGFNVERRVQRFQETIRWANVRRDQWFIQTSRAGLLTNLPEFNYGLGMNIRPSIVTGYNKAGEGTRNDWRFEPSLDASQRIGPNVLATLTINTDFAETEVDTRRTNLTRFPLFFPEKRSFFLEGSDIFEFGFGTGRETVIPFFSRRIGLYDGEQVPIIAGGKVNGRINKTAFGGLVIGTDGLMTAEDSLRETTMGVVRVRQNILGESSVGIIASAGDQQGIPGSFMSGADFTYQTTRFKGNKNFLAGAWVLYTDRDGLTGDQSSYGFKVDYPNDLWDVAIVYSKIGDGFDPSLGFVPRKGIHFFRAGGTYAPRPDWPWVRQMRFQFFPRLITDLDGKWQTYRVFTAPINWRLESGDRFEINYMPRGERLDEPFEISDGVIIPVGEYHFTRYRLEFEFARKRRLNGQLSWWFGSFYEGKLDEIQAEVNWTPSNLLSFEFSGVRNIGRLPWGHFDQTLIGLRVRFNVTADLQLNSFIQYDTVSRTMGINARIHWIYSPLGDMFIVYNHNVMNALSNGWLQETSQLVFKVRYNFRL